MKMIPVDCVPERAHGKHKLQELIQEFVDMEAKTVKLDFTQVEAAHQGVASW